MRSADMRRAEMPPEPAATHATNRDHMTPRGKAWGPPTDWVELVQVHDDRAIFQASPDALPVIDIHSL